MIILLEGKELLKYLSEEILFQYEKVLQNTDIILFLKNDDMQSWFFAYQPSGRDVRDNILHDYRCLKFVCSPETCTFCY